MARPVSARSFVALFEKLSFDRQGDLLTQLHAAHDQVRAEKRAELEKQLAELGYAAPKKRGRPRIAKTNGAGETTASRAARKGGKRRAVKAKYRDGKTGETWSGRGRMAGWLKSKLDAGEKLENYLLN